MSEDFLSFAGPAIDETAKQGKQLRRAALD